MLLLLALNTPLGCTHVIKYDGTPYYNEGPQQIEQPNGALSAGTGVWIIGEKLDYKRVWTLDFVIAYVWGQDLVTQWEWWEMEKERKAREKREKREEEEEREWRKQQGGPFGQR